MSKEKQAIENDILFQIDMELYDKFNDIFCEMNEWLGEIYSWQDLKDLEDSKNITEINLLRQAVQKQQKQLEVEKNTNKNLAKENQKYFDLAMDLQSEIVNNYIPKSKIQDLKSKIIKEESYFRDKFDKLFEKETITIYKTSKMCEYLACEQELGAIRGMIEELLEEENND